MRKNKKEPRKYGSAHGTISSYVNKKCRCETCKRAWNDYTCRRRAIAKKLAVFLDNKTHGVVSTYTNFGCRCKECTEAVRVYNKDRRDSKKYNKFIEDASKQLEIDEKELVKQVQEDEQETNIKKEISVIDWDKIDSFLKA